MVSMVLRRPRIVLVLFLLAVCAALPAADLATLTILHTNDLHAQLTPLDNGRGGFAALAGVIRRERDGCRDCLLIDAGDAVQGSPVSTIFKGSPVYDLINLFRYDAATIGNHEFDYGPEQVRKLLRSAAHPVVLANVDDGRGALLGAAPYVVIPVNGLRVAVIGLLTGEMKTLSTPALMGPWRVAPVMAAARRWAAEARRNADVVVLAGHLVAAEEAVILHTIPDIAIVVSGHEHTGMKAPLSEGDRVLVRVQAKGEELGRLETVVNKETKSLASWNWKRIPVDRGSPVAADVAREVARWEAEVARVVDRPIGASEREFNPQEVRALIEEAMIQATGADFAFMNQGGVRARIPRGPLLERHIWNVMPFDNLVVTAKVKGRALPAVVAQGRAVDPEKTYSLAVSDFTAANQSDPSQLGVTGLEFSNDGPLLRDVILDYVRSRGILK